jgi:hypothetical protein
LKVARHSLLVSGFGWREAVLALLILAPLACLFLFVGPIPQDQSFHVLADRRELLGVPNFADVASNLPFLLVGAMGVLWSFRIGAGARSSWMVLFLGVALVFFGSGYYHLAPRDDSLVWDRLPMTLAFMGLLAALLSEHLSERIELPLLAAALAVGIGSVLLWRHTDDLRVYIWVQAVGLLVIPYLLAAYPGRHTHRRYLLYGLGLYALAKAAELSDQQIFALTGGAVSGHTLKHLLAAAAPYCVYLMLRRRGPLEGGRRKAEGGSNSVPA